MNLVEILFKRRNDNSIALKYGNCEISYSQLWKESVKVSEWDTDSNTISGIMITNSIEFVIAFFAILIKGKTALLIKPEIKKYELNAMIDKCNIGFIYTMSKYMTLISSIEKNINVVYMDIPKPQKNIYMNKIHKFKYNKNDVAVILPTSGTTSDKKFAQLTHKNIFSNIKAISDIYNLKEGERELLSLPMTSAFCLTVELLNCLYAGMSIVIYDGIFSLKHFLKLIDNEKIDYFITVPSVLKSLSTLSNRSYFKMENVKRITIGGEKVSLVELENFYVTFSNTIIIYGYGMTECSPVITTKVLTDYKKKPLSVGKVISGVEVRVIDDNGKNKEINELGEIIVKGHNVMKGYYGTDYSIIKNGWLYTGDIGYLDEEGYLYITGRKKNMIISAGQNIYPEEVEEVILNSGLVCETRVRGVKDDAMGEIVVADVVLKKIEKANIDKIKNFCIQNLSLYKIPKKFVICNELEKTDTNKIKRE